MADVTTTNPTPLTQRAAAKDKAKKTKTKTKAKAKAKDKAKDKDKTKDESTPTTRLLHLVKRLVAHLDDEYDETLVAKYMETFVRQMKFDDGSTDYTQFGKSLLELALEYRNEAGLDPIDWAFTCAAEGNHLDEAIASTAEVDELVQALKTFNSCMKITNWRAGLEYGTIKSKRQERGEEDCYGLIAFFCGNGGNLSKYLAAVRVLIDKTSVSPKKKLIVMAYLDHVSSPEFVNPFDTIAYNDTKVGLRQCTDADEAFANQQRNMNTPVVKGVMAALSIQALPFVEWTLKHQTDATALAEDAIDARPKALQKENIAKRRELEREQKKLISGDDGVFAHAATRARTIGKCRIAWFVLLLRHSIAGRDTPFEMQEAPSIRQLSEDPGVTEFLPFEFAQWSTHLLKYFTALDHAMYAKTKPLRRRITAQSPIEARHTPSKGAALDGFFF